MKTAIVLIADRSGSMKKIKEEAEGAINAFFESQKAVEGEAEVSAYEFDNEYGVVFERVDINNVPHFTIKPRGMTALLDAIGRTVVDFNTDANKTIYVIMTDGLENASQEWNNETVKTLIDEAKARGDEFVYLGANQNAIEVGANMGIPVASSLTFAANKHGLDGMSKSMSNYVTATRSGLAYEFTDSDRKQASGLTDSD
jgi:Mg-chelatase subunit ChlD